MTLVGVQGTPLKIYGKAEVDLVLDGVSGRFHPQVTVADSLTFDIILGQEFLSRSNCVIDMGRKVVQFPNCQTTLVSDGEQDRNLIHVSTVSVMKCIPSTTQSC